MYQLGPLFQLLTRPVASSEGSTGGTGQPTSKFIHTVLAGLHFHTGSRGEHLSSLLVVS